MIKAIGNTFKEVFIELGKQWIGKDFLVLVLFVLSGLLIIIF